MRVGYLSESFEAGGYKNRVGGRVVELFDRFARVSIESSCLTSSESMWEGKLATMITFWSNFCKGKE